MDRRQHSHRNCDCHRDKGTIKMSVNYAAGLSPYPYKGKCGLPERLDPTDSIEAKVMELTGLIRESKHMVAIVGAGISTACGIPDFRGPKGVWTLEEKGCIPESSVSFDSAIPSITHMALVALEKAGYLKYLISQNVDGLTIRSGFPMNRMGELHGNVFMEQCDYCHAQYYNSEAVSTMGLNFTGKYCTQTKRRGHCRGKLRDTLLDWEDELPEKELFLAEFNCRKADICLCLGTSLQIVPCGNFPRDTKAKGGKVAIVNLQTTKQDRICDLRLWAYCDDVMSRVCEQLGVEIPGWNIPIVVLYSRNTGEKEKKENKIIFGHDVNLVEDGEDLESFLEKKGEKPDINKLTESRVNLIKSVEVPGMKRETGLGDIAAAAAIAAAAVRRIPSPKDPAPAPPSDDEDELRQGTIMATSLNTLPSITGTYGSSIQNVGVQQLDASQLMQHMQPGQMLTVTQVPAGPGGQQQQTFRLNTVPEEPQPPLVQHVILSADGSQTTGQVLYAQGRNSEGYIVYGPTPPDNQAQVYLDHNIVESDQTVITQEPLANTNMEAAEEQVMNVPQVQQVTIVEHEVTEDQPNIVPIMAGQRQVINQDQFSNITLDSGQVINPTTGQVINSNGTSVLTTGAHVLSSSDGSQVLATVDNGQTLTSDTMQEIDLTVKQESQAAGHMPVTVVQLEQPVTTRADLDLSSKNVNTVSLLAADNSIPAKKRKYIETE